MKPRTQSIHRKLVVSSVLILVVLGLFGVVQAIDLTSGAIPSTSLYTNDDASIAPEVSFSGDVTNLTLEQAIEKAKSSSSAATIADANQTFTEGVALHYDHLGMDAMREYAENQADRNYEAEKNALKRAVIEKYFTALQTRTAVQLSQTNAAVQQKLFDIATLKYKAGTISQNDLLKAQASASQAQTDLMSVQNGYTLALMTFNQSVGYPLMQNTVLTDTLDMPQQTLTDLGEAIARAKSHRNEVLSASFYKDYLGDVKNSAESDSGTDSFQYKEAKGNWEKAYQSWLDSRNLMEIDVRSKYMQVLADWSALVNAKLSVDKASSSVAIANVSLDQGLITIPDAQLALTELYQAQMQLIRSQLTYRLAIFDYEQAMTVGSTSIEVAVP